jgi:hypothetical protein
MAEEVTMAEYEAKKAELEKLEEALEAKGVEIVDAKGKPLFRSKIFWANVIAIGAMAGQYVLGYSLSGEEVAFVLGGVNILLRYFNKDISGVAN